MKDNKVIVVGAGLGGLQCAYILSKKGYEVTVLEKERNPGGCLQSFKREGFVFDTGFHYVGGLGEGQSLNALFKYFNLMDLPWVEMDRNCFDQVVIGEETYAFANGHDEFARVMADRFPDSRDSICKYVSFLRQVGDGIFDGLNPDYGRSRSAHLFAVSAWKYMSETFDDRKLIDVLSGTSMKIELRKETLPLYTFAQINDSFIRSAWRLKGGGWQIAESLIRSIEKMGGKVLTGKEVVQFIEDSAGVEGVRTADGDEFFADWVISSIHPAQTVRMTEQDGIMRKSFRKRITSLENTYGMFTLNLRVRKNKIPLKGCNVYAYRSGSSPWNLDPAATDGIMVSYNPPDEGDCVENIDILSPMSWAEVAQWREQRVGRRDDRYIEFKRSKSRKCIDMVQQAIPELSRYVEAAYSSSPLTWNHYTGTEEGCAFGIRKDFDNPLVTVLTPKTPVRNLFLTGQNLNLHGVLGVSMTSLYTCAEIIGKDAIWNEIEQYVKK